MDWLSLLISNIACWEGEDFKTESLASPRQFFRLDLESEFGKRFRHWVQKIIIKLNKLSLQFRACRIKLSKFRFLFIDLKTQCEGNSIDIDQ